MVWGMLRSFLQEQGMMPGSATTAVFRMDRGAARCASFLGESPESQLCCRLLRAVQVPQVRWQRDRGRHTTSSAMAGAALKL